MTDTNKTLVIYSSVEELTVTAPLSAVHVVRTDEGSCSLWVNGAAMGLMDEDTYDVVCGQIGIFSGRVTRCGCPDIAPEKKPADDGTAPASTPAPENLVDKPNPTASNPLGMSAAQLYGLLDSLRRQLERILDPAFGKEASPDDISAAQETP